MANVYPRDDRAFQRAVEVQRLVIPFLITHNATPANKVLATDEPTILFLGTENLSKITVAAGALDAGESVPTFDLVADDSDGKINLFVTLRDQKDSVVKIMQAQVIDRLTGAAYPCYPNVSAAAIVGSNLNQMCLNCDATVDLSSADLNACLIVEYITAT